MKPQDSIENAVKQLREAIGWEHVSTRYSERIGEIVSELSEISQQFNPQTHIEGAAVKPQAACELEVYVKPTTDNPNGYIRRQRWSTFSEVFKSLSKAMDLQQCEKCGEQSKKQPWNTRKPCKCGGDCFEIVDEYESGPGCYADKADHEIGFPYENLREIVCYAAVGGNEGYFANAGVILSNSRCNGRRYVHLYHIKSFRGMDHARELVKLMQRAMGIGE